MLLLRSLSCQLLRHGHGILDKTVVASSAAVTCRGQMSYYRPSSVLLKDKDDGPGLSSMFTQSVRFYYKHKTIKRPPSKELKFDYAGDLDMSLKELDKTLPKLGFEESEELSKAAEEVKKIFSLEFANAQDHKNKRIVELIEDVQLHPADTKSLEVRVAYLTIMIRNQISHCMKFRKDKAAKAQLVGRIQARKKYLRILRDLDYERFEWLLTTLKIKYVQDPKYNKKLSRRQIRKSEAWEHTHNKINEKLAEYKVQLAAEKELFLEEKVKVLDEIRQELETLDATDQEEILLKYPHLAERPATV